MNWLSNTEVIKKEMSGEAADAFRFLLSQKEVGCGVKPHKVRSYNLTEAAKLRFGRISINKKFPPKPSLILIFDQCIDNILKIKD